MGSGSLSTTASLPALGRDAELAALADVVDGARSGRGGALVVRGEPGVGKSLLLATVADTAEDLTLVMVTGVQSESDLAFGALSALLRPLLDGIGRLPAVQADALRAAVGLAAASQVEQLPCHAAVVALLAGAAAERPVLVIADDLQWFDAASRDAVFFAARRLASDAVAFVMAVRDGESEEPLRTGLPELHLSGLAEQPALALVARAAGEVSPAVARRLWAQTDGNPLALVEIPRNLSPEQRTGRVALDEPLPVGRRLEDSFAARAAALPEASRQALLVAATSYTGATDTLLAALSDLGLPATALDAAEEEDLVSIAHGSLTWRHPLVRSAVYHAAPAPARRAAHAALARAGGEARLPDHRAWHLAAAAAAPDETVAAELDQVAVEAARRGAPSTALRAFAQAAMLSPGEADRARREVEAAELALAVGRLDEALELLDGARSRSDDLRLRAHGERIRSRVEMLRGSPHAAHDRLVAIADAIADVDRPLAAAAMTEAVLARTVTGPVPAYRETAERAFALARGLGGEVEAMAAVALGCGLLLSAETDAGLELFARYGAIVEKPEVWHSAPELPGMYACLHASIERFETADRLFTAMTTSAREQGALRALPYPMSGRALVDLELGRWPAALAGAEEAVELSREMAGPGMLASSLAALAQVEASMGRPEATRAHAEESLAICKQLNAWAVEPEPVLALASLALSLGEHEEAASVWARTTVDIREWVLEPGWEHLDDVMIEASVRVGRTAQAERELAELEAKAQRTGRTWAHAVAARCRGLLATTPELDEHFQRALEWHDRAPLPFTRARTQLCYGERLRRARRRVDAREQLTRASATFHALGATIWAERAERELAAAGYSRQSPAEQSPWAELTAAETRVARVILEGATYEEAASALFVSPRTIETHLRQIYRKVGVRSRSEMTRRLALREAA
ncbi:MAG TPA: AAA family ATPase [Solirubrobacteraceae bacterium]|nr:AAA family ATPase [Solirubrobacteraceae bacterium]